MSANDLWNGVNVGLLLKDFSSAALSPDYEKNSQCISRDLFQARLDTLFQRLNDPLLIAVCGEIGNNSFDHNLGNWLDLSGVIFLHWEKEGIILIADRGQGVKNSLLKIVPDLKNDKEALKTAFTRVVSGRSPEHRGNGLKFVASAVEKNRWTLYFHSGNSYAVIRDGRMAFEPADLDIKGTVAVLKY